MAGDDTCVSDRFAGLNPPYSTLVVDPPWQYDDAPTGYQRSVGKTTFLPYSSMTVGEIAALPVFDLSAPGAHLYLWTTQRYLFDARDIALGWGFQPVTTLTWCKPLAGKGPGGTFVNTTEFVIFARRTNEKREVERAGALIRNAREAAKITRAELHRIVRGGKPTGIVFRWEDDDSLPTEADWAKLQEALPELRGVTRPYVAPPDDKGQPTRAESTWFQWPRAHHSAKPPAFGDLVESVSAGPYVELFARDQRLGWDAWGHGYESEAV